MKPLQERMDEANRLLLPYAVPHGGGLGREVSEPEDGARFPFQRDRDRIVHTQAFRRLQGKTQVFVSGGGDHYRTRLTHTMEVAQIARDLARTLRLNEDLTECIALAHDLGHPPFGHSGEEELNTWMREHGLHFEHNQQTVRIVTVLEEHSSLYAGLNLNREVLGGLMKHREKTSDISASRAFSLEAQVVNLSDEIAYNGHDCDDGLRAAMFSGEDVIDASSLARAASEKAVARGTSLRGGIIHLLVSDLRETSERILAKEGIRTPQDVHQHGGTLLAFSEAMQPQLQELRAFLWYHLYLHSAVTEKNRAGRRIVRSLCERFFKSPPGKILAIREQTGSSLPEAVKDYVAGMTDGYARWSTGIVE